MLVNYPTSAPIESISALVSIIKAGNLSSSLGIYHLWNISGYCLYLTFGQPNTAAVPFFGEGTTETDFDSPLPKTCEIDEDMDLAAQAEDLDVFSNPSKKTELLDEIEKVDLEGSLDRVRSQLALGPTITTFGANTAIVGTQSMGVVEIISLVTTLLKLIRSLRT